MRLPTLLLLILLLILLARAEEPALSLEARAVFRAEGCWQCHAEVSGFPIIDEARRTGPVLERTRLPRSPEWHAAHLYDPRSLDADSAMPEYARHFTSLFSLESADFLSAFGKRDGGFEDDGIVTRREYEAAGGEEWERVLPIHDRNGDGVVGFADAAPLPSPELQALIDCLVAEGPERPPASAPPRTPPPPVSEASLARGERLFQKHCAGCHGVRGDGQGIAAPFFGSQTPRNFLRGEFKFRSSLAPLPPLDEDLFRTIRGGAGPSMPAWPTLSDRQIWDLVALVKGSHPLFLPRELTIEGPDGKVVAAFTRSNEELAEVAGIALPDGNVVKRAGRWYWFAQRRERPIEEGETIGGYRFRFGAPVYDWMEGVRPRALDLPRGEIAYTKESADLGARVYAELQCGQCHGEGGRGDGPSAEQTRGSLGQIVRPTDYTRGVKWLKAGATSEDLVRTFLAGMQGTPMPSFAENFAGLASAPADEAPWHLAHFVLRQAGVAPR